MRPRDRDAGPPARGDPGRREGPLRQLGEDRNPRSAPEDVTRGERTTDETGIGFVQLTLDDVHRKNKLPARRLVPKAG